MTNLHSSRELGPTIQELINQLKAPVVADRILAALHLGERYYRDPQIIAPLIKVLEDREATVRAAAARSLGNTGRIPAVATEAQHALERLLVLLKDENEHVVASAIYAIGQLGNSSLGHYILPFLDHPNKPDVKILNVTIESLASLRYEPAIPRLRHLLQDTEPEVRGEALQALWSLRRAFDINMIEILTTFLTDPHPVLRNRAKLMLEIINKEDIGK